MRRDKISALRLLAEQPNKEHSSSLSYRRFRKLRSSRNGPRENVRSKSETTKAINPNKVDIMEEQANPLDVQYGGRLNSSLITWLSGSGK